MSLPIFSTVSVREEVRSDAPVGDIGAGADLRGLHARTERIAKAVLFALALAIVMITAAAPGIGEGAAVAEGESRLGGDFPAFFAAGSIVLDGDIDDLYDANRQALAQENLGIDGYLAFAYPPHVAAAYSPLSALGFRAAYILHTFAMAAALYTAVYMLGTFIPSARRWRWQILAGAFTFYPAITAVTGGQNAALSVLTLSIVWWALRHDREIIAGVAAGLLAFRPQYALPIIGLMLLSRHWRAVLAATVTMAATWAVTAIRLGTGWLPTWADAVVPFVERDAEVNAANSISILGFLQAVWSPEATPAVIVGAIGAAGVVVTLMWMWLRPGRFLLSDRIGAVAIGALLISPHTMFYDAALLLVAGAALLARHDAGQMTIPVARCLGLAWLLGWTQLFAAGLGATPLAIVVAASFVAFVASAKPAASAKSLRVVGSLGHA